MIQVLLVILLLEGFVTISVEILAIRQLLPFFGGSVVITSIIIGVFLLFLALGYWRGGMYRGSVINKLCANFAFAFLGIGLGLSYTFIGWYYQVIINQWGISVLWGLTGYLLLVLAPIVYWLGQTLPLTTHLFNQELHVSRISGKALFISTLGSFLGAILTALILFQYLGVAWTVVINCLILFSLILYMKPLSDWSWGKVLVLGLGLIVIKVANINIENLLFVKTNNYGNYSVINSEQYKGKILNINNSDSSLMTADNQGFPYIQWVRDFLFNQLKLEQKKILVIGAGGFSLTADNQHQNEVYYIDIDPDIKQIAEDSFLNKPIQGAFLGQDARAYLNQTKTQYDVIISDAYSNQSTVPSSLLTREYFQSIAAHLAPSGLMLVNIIANPFFTDKYAQNVSNTIRSVFPHCAIVPVQWQNTLVNVLYVCSNTSGKQAIYSDNLNTATFDFFKRPT